MSRERARTHKLDKTSKLDNNDDTKLWATEEERKNQFKILIYDLRKNMPGYKFMYADVVAFVNGKIFFRSIFRCCWPFGE